MANKKKTNAIATTEQGLTVVTQADYDRLNLAKSIIADAQDRAEGLAERIAGQLYVVNLHKLYELEDCKTTAEWADREFGISKGTVSDAINTFTRFGDMDNKDRIADKYAGYMFSSLIKMKALSDEQIETAGIQPTMSRAQIVDAIKALKVLEDKQAELPKLVKKWGDEWNELTKALEDDKQAVRFIERYCPEYFTADKMTNDMYELLISKANEYFELRNEWDEVSYKMQDAGLPIVDDFHVTVIGADWKERDYFNEELKAVIDAANSLLSEQPEKDEQDEQDEQNEQDEQDEQEQESAPHTMPTIQINVADFTTDGKTNTKELLARVKEELAKVIAHEADIVITNIG